MPKSYCLFFFWRDGTKKKGVPTSRGPDPVGHHGLGVEVFHGSHLIGTELGSESSEDGRVRQEVREEKPF